MEEQFETVLEVAGEKVLIVTHELMHADEAGAMLMLQICGTKQFLEKYAPTGRIELGIGGGPFDEHDNEGKEKKEKGQCAMSLMAKALGVESKPRWKKILKFVNLNDSGGSRNPRDIATLLKNMHFQNPFQQEENVNWFNFGLWIKYKYDYKNGDFTIDQILEVIDGNKIKEVNGQKWFNKGMANLWAHQKMYEFAMAEVERRVRKKQITIETIQVAGQSATLVVVEGTKNYRMPSALRAVDGLNADIIIVRNQYGHTLIAPGNIIMRRRMNEVIAVLRLWEQQSKVSEKQLSVVITSNWKGLHANGDVAGAEVWYFHKELKMIFNGTLTHPSIPQTILKTKEIIEAVKIGLGDFFRHEECQEGLCLSGKKCNWYAFGLYRCRQNFIKQRKEKPAA